MSGSDSKQQPLVSKILCSLISFDFSLRYELNSHYDSSSCLYNPQDLAMLTIPLSNSKRWIPQKSSWCWIYKHHKHVNHFFQLYSKNPKHHWTSPKSLSGNHSQPKNHLFKSYLNQLLKSLRDMEQSIHLWFKHANSLRKHQSTNLWMTLKSLNNCWTSIRKTIQ